MRQEPGAAGSPPVAPEGAQHPLPGARAAADAGSVFPDLLCSLAAIGRSMQEEFDPKRFLEQFSARVERLIPHDRLVIAHLEDDGRTFTRCVVPAKFIPSPRCRLSILCGPAIGKTRSWPPAAN